ncbi:hypothetical protein V6N00_04665 [Tersicoccus sp. MR15.9]|uniref:hypothetical protein n=1 Tax=Tersicoccus mangrovi TaxID=3121635 RepID=UPI002FE52525
MRAVLTLPTPGRTLTRDDTVEALRSTSWLPHQGPETEAWRREQVERLKGNLPDAVQQQLALGESIFIQVDSVEGLVSLEREEVVLIRLFGTTESIEAIKDAVNKVAGTLPRAFMHAFGETTTELRLDDEVVIRQAGDDRTLAKGVIATPNTLRFGRYVVTERPRERSLLVWLVVLAVLIAVVSVSPVVLGWTGVAWSEVKGYGGRIASALVMAILTTVINLVFEYRDWRNDRTEVQWLFG